MLEFALGDNPLTPQAPNDLKAILQNVRTYGEEEIIKMMMNSGAGLTESDIVSVLRAFEKTLTEIIADGGAIHTPIFRASPSIQGVFETREDVVDGVHRKVHLNLQPGTALRDAAKEIKTHKLPVLFSGTYIVEVWDMKTETINDQLSPGRDLKITGVKVKIAGDDPTVGLYFVPAGGATPIRVDPKDLVVNKPSELIAPIPTLPSGQYQARIVTQYSGAGRFLKTPHIATFEHTLTVV